MATSLHQSMLRGSDPEDVGAAENHPTNRSIDHYIAGFGYSSNGSNVKWADPATSIWPGLAKKGNMSASTMAGFVSRFGIIA